MKIPARCSRVAPTLSRLFPRVSLPSCLYPALAVVRTSSQEVASPWAKMSWIHRTTQNDIYVTWHDMIIYIYIYIYIYIIYNHIYLHLCISYICMYIYFYWLHLFTELSTCLARCCGSFGLASIVLVVIHVDELILGTENNITWLTTMVGVWLVVMQWKITIFHEIHYKWPCLIAILT